MRTWQLTERQALVWTKVTRAATSGSWYRAAHPGERVTLASLWRRGLVRRRCHRGREGEANAAHEYAALYAPREAAP